MNLLIAGIIMSSIGKVCKEFDTDSFFLQCVEWDYSLMYGGIAMLCVSGVLLYASYMYTLKYSFLKKYSFFFQFRFL